MSQTISTRNDWNEITDELGKRFEISFNTYKPFACGIVIHPAIDAAAQLRGKGVKAEGVERVELKVHPLVLELTGNKEPQDGLQGKFSVYHGFAAGLIFGRAGEGEYADDIVRRDDVVALRRKVKATVDTSIAEDAVDAIVHLRGGKQEHVHVDHAVGSLKRPVSDADLEAKFRSLADPILGTGKASSLVQHCWKLAEAKDVKALVAAARP
jgi:2-methylcitrate dehydratase PrpD